MHGKAIPPKTKTFFAVDLQTAQHPRGRCSRWTLALTTANCRFILNQFLLFLYFNLFELQWLLSNPEVVPAVVVAAAVEAVVEASAVVIAAALVAVAVAVVVSVLVVC